MIHRMALSLSVLLVATACSGSDATNPTGRMASSTVSAAAASSSRTSSPRSGALHVTKECSAYHGLAGEHCTITSSSLKQIEVGSTVTYARSAVAGLLDTDVVLDPPGPGNNSAFGHCTLNLVTVVGRCSFDGGTGKFRHFTAQVNVTLLGARPNFAWDGWYSFRK
jgi:hypothetical protein